MYIYNASPMPTAEERCDDERVPSCERNCCGPRVQVSVPFGTFLANSLRRALVADTSSLMADRVRVHINTSNAMDERIAQRIGLLRFVQDDDTPRESHWHARGTDVLAQDARGRASLDGTAVVVTARDPLEEVRVSATFRRSTGAEHARFCPVVAVGCAPSSECEGHAVVSYGTLFCHDAERVWEEACDSLLARVDAVRRRVRESAAP
jgi:hypothetical protein